MILIINKIIISNFGVYGGINEFDFRPKANKTIILCGGKNGAGKTTLFESIMLCFYGKEFDPETEKNYEKKIMRSFHRNLKENTTCTESSISIEFEIAFEGKAQEYKITRTWKNIDGKVNEDLSIKKSDSKSKKFKELGVSIPKKKNRHTQNRFEEIDSVEKSEWQQFINQRIPRGIVKLFFFDGEKIQSIADDGAENKYIQSSFDTLLGLDLVNQLQKDIRLLLTREDNNKRKDKEKDTDKNNSLTQKQLNHEMKKEELIKFVELRKGYDDFKKTHDNFQHLDSFEVLLRFCVNTMSEKEFTGVELESLRFLEEILDDKMQKLEEEIREKNESITPVHNDFLLVTEEFQKIGGKYYDKNKKMEDDEKIITSKLIITEKEIRDVCSTELPFSLIPKQLGEIKNQIKSDQKVTLQIFEKEVFDKNTNKISLILNSKTFLPDISSNIKNTVSEELVKSLKNDLDELSSAETFFNLSSSQIEQFLNMIDNSQKSTLTKIEKLTQSYNIQKNSLDKFEHTAKIKPKIDEIRSIMTKRDALRDKENRLQEKCHELEMELGERQIHQKMLNSKIRISLERETQSMKYASGDVLAYSVLSVLDDYSESLREEKITILENYVLEGLTMLLHKKDFIHKVKIDKDDFVVKLFNTNGKVITKNMLSKGELQIYATALVWGLAKTSGMPLPFMIDTPLARLDVDHRSSLVEHFFPKTSQQTIVLSTDSEIDSEYHKKLKPYISKSYTMNFDSVKGKTTIQDGYFFDEAMNVEV